MAFVPQTLPQEEQNQFAPSGQTTPNPLALLPPQAAQTGGSAGQGGGATAGSAPTAGTPTQFGSNASKLSDYLAANQDQVQNMANNIAGNLGSQYSGVKGSIDQAGQQFGGLVSAGYTPSDPTLLSQVQSNPTQAAADPNNVKSFRSQLNDQYTGPTSFEASSPYAGVQENITSAVQQAGQLNSYPGLSTYLQNNVEKNATPGQNTLDTALLQGNQPAYQTVQDAAKPFGTLPDYLKGVAQTQDQSVQAAQAAAPAAKAAAQAALQGATGNLNNNVNKELGAAQKQVGDYNTELQKAQGTLASDLPLINQLQNILGQYGGSFTGGTVPPWADPTKVSIPNQAMAIPSAGQVAQPQDYETLAALTALSGNPINSPIDASTAAQAGSYKAPGAIDNSQLTGAMKSMLDFLRSPQANNINVPGNLNQFVTSGNTWATQLQQAYNQMLYGGNGQPFNPFTIGNAPPPTPPGQGGPPFLGGV